MRKFETLSIPRISPYNYFNVHFKHSHRQKFQTGQTEMMDNVKVLQGCFKKDLRFEEKRYSGKFGRIAEGNVRGKNSLYLALDRISLTKDYLLQAVGENA